MYFYCFLIICSWNLIICTYVIQPANDTASGCSWNLNILSFILEQWRGEWRMGATRPKMILCIWTVDSSTDSSSYLKVNEGESMEILCIIQGQSMVIFCLSEWMSQRLSLFLASNPSRLTVEESGDTNKRFWRNWTVKA